MTEDTASDIQWLFTLVPGWAWALLTTAVAVITSSLVCSFFLPLPV